MRLLTFALTCALVARAPVAEAQEAVLTAFPPPSANSIGFYTGGLLSNWTQAYVDLDTGLFVYGVAKRGSAEADERYKPIKPSRVVSLDPPAVNRLRDLAARSASGGISKCVFKRGDPPPPPPNPHYVESMTFILDGNKSQQFLFCPLAETQAIIAILKSEAGQLWSPF